MITYDTEHFASELDAITHTIESTRKDIARTRLRRHRVSPWRAANLDAWIEDAEARLARDIEIWRSWGYDVR